MPAELGSGSPHARPAFHGAYPPSVERKWDTLRPDKLPPHGDTSLDFRLQPLLPHQDTGRALKTIVVVVVVAAITPSVASLFELASRLAVPPSMPFWFALATTLLLVRFAHQFTAHGIAWMLANPRLNHTQRRIRLRWWRLRFNWLWLSAHARLLRRIAYRRRQRGLDAHPRTRVLEERARDLDTLRWFPAQLLLGGAAVAYVLLAPHLAQRPAGALAPRAAALLVAGLLLLLAGAFTAPRGLRPFGRTAVTWLRYGLYGDHAPGVFRSPAGLSSTRFLFFVLLAGAIALIAIPPMPFADVAGHALLGSVRLFTDGITKVFDENLSTMLWQAAFYTAVPPALLAGTLLFVSGPVLARFWRAVEAEDAYEPAASSHNPWDALISRVQQSTNATERDSVLLGTHATENYPVLLPANILNEHMHVTGDTGSGKTALALIPLLIQLIRGRSQAIIVLDLKGDPALFHTTRIEAERAGRTFKYFTNRIHCSTYLFNPFTTLSLQHLSVNQLCEIFLQSLGLEHGLGYGRSYFSRVARDWLSQQLEGPPIESFEQLLARAQDQTHFASAKHQQDAYELVSVVRTLAKVPQLNVIDADDHPAAAHAIHLPTVLADAQIVYFYLPAAIEAASVREIANLVVHSLLTSADGLQARTGRVAPGLLVIDEFQRMVSRGFDVFLQQARSLGLGTVLSHQTISDLKSPDIDLRPLVQANTRTKQVFSASDLQQQNFLMEASGDTLYQLTSVSRSTSTIGTATDTVTVTPYVGKRLTQNDIIDFSNDPQTSIAHVTRSAGFLHWGGYPNPVRHDYCMSFEEYSRRTRLPWPAVGPTTVLSDALRKPPAPDVPPQATADSIPEPEVVLPPPRRRRSDGAGKAQPTDQPRTPPRARRNPIRAQ